VPHVEKAMSAAMKVAKRDRADTAHFFLCRLMYAGDPDTTRAWLCSGNVSEPPEILQCSRESDMERQCTLGKSCKNRTLTHEPWMAR
jgi:hypothetical protein